MLFNSLQFLIFLPIVFAIYWLLSQKTKWQNLLIVVASYYFYGVWDSRFLILIFFTTASSFISGWLIERYNDKYGIRKIVCGCNLFINFAILAIFKYFNFFTENINLIFKQFGYQLDWVTLDILLPVGISFYTFQAVSYPIDVYRRKISATKDFIAFAAFVSFFPQLVAGPIEMSTNLLPQILKERHFDYTEAVSGMRQILWGFFKKLVIADNCAYIVNQVYADIDTCNSSMLICGAVFFTFQIYGDFSGYSDIAIGTSKLFGIKLLQNFHYPYLSRNPGEFWRRWHISLNKWFMDYVYIPLGGNRKGRMTTIVNLMIVFTLSGLWHGASWNFVLWGAFNGIILVMPLMFLGKGYKKYNTSIAANSIFPNSKECIGVFYTFIITLVGWIIFRCDNINEIYLFLNGIISNDVLKYPNYFDIGVGNLIFIYTISFIIILYLVEYIQRLKLFALDLSDIKNKYFRLAIYTLVIYSIIIFSGSREKFIYFQF